MATHSGPIAVPTELQAANALALGNGASIDLTGASRAMIVLTSIAGTAGIYTFEISRDGGTNWEAANAVRLGSTADSVAVVAATPAGAPAAVYKVDQINGPALLRARISTAWVTSAPAVTAYRIG